MEELFKTIYNSGVFGVNGVFSSIGGQYLNPDNLGIDTYETMLRNDETCRSGYEYMALVATANVGEYSHPDEKIKDFINYQFENLRGSITTVVQEILSAIWAGFSVGEMILVPGNGGSVNLQEIQFLHPKTVQFALHTEGEEKNRIKEIRQGYYTIGTPIPREKVIIYTHSGRFGNPYGESRFRCIYNDYFFKSKLLNLWGMCLEKYGIPTAIVKVKNASETVNDNNGNKISNLENAHNIVSDIGKGISVAITEAIESIEFVQIQRAMGGDFESAINYANKMIYRGLLLPSLMESGEKGGSYALGDVHYKMFQFAIDKIRNDVTEVLLDQLVKPLIIWNFGVQNSYGVFAYNNVDPSTSKIFSEIFASMTTAGYISPSQKSDMDLVREKLGLPGMSDESWQKAQDDKKAQQEETTRRLQDAQREIQQTKEPPAKAEDKNKTESGDTAGQPGEDLQASMVGLEDADDKQRTLEADMDPGSIFRRNMDNIYYMKKRAQA